MSDATLPVWALIVIPLGSAFVGAASGPLTEHLRSKSEWDKRDADRKALLVDRRDEAYRQAIYDTQVALEALAAAAFELLEKGLDDDTAQRKFLLASNHLETVEQRILSDDARTSVEAARKSVRGPFEKWGKGQPQPDQALSTSANQAVGALGSRLRELWSGRAEEAMR